MLDIAKAARAALVKAETDLAFAKKQLERVETNCVHNWNGPKYDPIVHKAYTIPPEYRGGFKYSSEIYVPEKREDRWVRNCVNCGKVEETKQATHETVVHHSPVF